MFRWCSYCQSFMGESEPRDNFTLTHGVCAKCRPKVRTITQQELEGVMPIKLFFNELQSSILSLQKFDKSKIMAEANRLNINAADLLAGVMQPLLYEIGKMYQEGKIPAVQEHKFSMMIKELIRDIRMELLANIPEKQNTEVLLACANGNFHEFGISLLELHLKKAGVSVESLYPGLPPDQLVAYAKQLNVKVVGLSVSMENQLAEVEEVARLFNESKGPRPYVIVGGFVIRSTTPPIDGATLFSGSIEELVRWVVEHLKDQHLESTAG